MHLNPNLKHLMLFQILTTPHWALPMDLNPEWFAVSPVIPVQLHTQLYQGMSTMIRQQPLLFIPGISHMQFFQSISMLSGNIPCYFIFITAQPRNCHCEIKQANNCKCRACNRTFRYRLSGIMGVLQKFPLHHSCAFKCKAKRGVLYHLRLPKVQHIKYGTQREM